MLRPFAKQDANSQSRAIGIERHLRIMTKEEITKRIQDNFGSSIEIVESTQPEAYVYISPEKCHDFCRFLHDDPELDFDFLFQLAGVHYADLSAPDNPDNRFEVVLCLSSHEKIHRLVVKVKLDKDNPEVATVSDIWQAANWYEREALELFGIKFTGHPDPRPLLLYDDWEYGYPMRKGWTGPDFVPMPEK
jgi:NADH-quinone oxidoreductase subunit C